MRELGGDGRERGEEGVELEEEAFERCCSGLFWANGREEGIDLK